MRALFFLQTLCFRYSYRKKWQGDLGGQGISPLGEIRGPLEIVSKGVYCVIRSMRGGSNCWNQSGLLPLWDLTMSEFWKEKSSNIATCHTSNNGTIHFLRKNCPGHLISCGDIPWPPWFFRFRTTYRSEYWNNSNLTSVLRYCVFSS